MKLTIQVLSTGKQIPLEVDENSVIEDIKVVLEVETGISGALQVVVHNGRYIQEETTRTLKYLGVKDGHTLIVANQTDLQQNPAQANLLEAQMLIQYYKSNRTLLDELLTRNRPLGEAVVSENIAYVQNHIFTQKQQKLLQQMQHAMELQRLEANIMDPENQRKIEEMIKMQRINENLQYAEEEMPESFIKVHMLYIDCSVNNIPMHAFVDTGAQSTIMSKRCAEKTQLLKMMDERYKGKAVGVGTSNIIGRIHAAQLEIGGKYFPCSFLIIDSDTLNVDMILGLDNLRRHRCNIDLAENVLAFMGGEVKVPFLAEHVVKESFYSEGIPPELLQEEVKQVSKEVKKMPPAAPKVAPPAKPVHSETEAKIARLVQEGIRREEAMAILASFNGNLEMALMYVLQQKSGF